MIKLLCLIMMSVSVSSVAYGSSKAERLKLIHELCMSRFARTLDTRKPVCDCSVRNLGSKNNEQELAFIFQFLKNKKAPLKLNDEQTMLIEFSTDVSERCIKDPQWTVDQ